MDTRHNNQLITTLVTRMVLQIAPHEMKLFQGQKEEYLRNPQQIINKRGFTNQDGTSEKILFLAPIIRAILCEAIFMLEHDTNSENNNNVSELTTEKAKIIYTFAHKKACEYQLAPQKAHLVAEAVLENLL